MASPPLLEKRPPDYSSISNDRDSEERNFVHVETNEVNGAGQVPYPPPQPRQDHNINNGYPTGGYGPHVPPQVLQIKSLSDAYVLAVILGFFGAHHFYLKRPGWGLLYFFTLGLFGIGYIVDLFRLPSLVQEANRRIAEPYSPPLKTQSDAYVLWFPFGLLGFHHFYLGRPGWGILYLFTLGLFGIGWLVDAFRMKTLVSKANRKITANQSTYNPSDKQLLYAYLLHLFPFTGLLGGHHFYLRRWGFGGFYFCTWGMLGIGWLVDLFRLPILVRRANKTIQYEREKKYLDDCYILWLVFGIFGSHHFFLRRYCWGVLYFFTFGLFGLGWLIDVIRIPFLVKEYNQTLARNITFQVVVDVTPSITPSDIPRTVNVDFGNGPQTGYFIPPVNPHPVPLQQPVGDHPHPYQQTSAPYPIQRHCIDAPPSYQEAVGNQM